MNWKAILSNPYFTTAEGAAAGFLATWAYGWVNSGAAWPINWRNVLTGAAGAAIVAVYNLYKQSPNATVISTSTLTVETPAPKG
jgi:hypothetical protein